MGGTPAVKMLREAMVGDEVDAGRRHPQRHLQLHPDRDGGLGRAPSPRCWPRPSGWATPRPIPTMDVGGFDAGHKITILAALAFGCAPDLRGGRDRGDRGDRAAGHPPGQGPRLPHQAGRLGRRGRPTGVSVRVHPALAPLDHPLAQAGGALNALFIEGERIGRIFVQGPGAGGGPTAAAVAADIADVMTGARRPVFQAPGRRPASPSRRSMPPRSSAAPICA